ncbi:hypothetical protein D9619_006200 [Psilocybe cf. subviscida]|uniref:Transcriptional regulator of RNA polII, SAGA, subunit-domain-containing protein n=1 Tax=Psilocybe cf. subviscida TaxID=2480587 RepID=A0A8H5B4S4_9AGAR|nr:hypothetical protein D9619_006200 [Psilocybe cf. subviscida]
MSLSSTSALKAQLIKALGPSAQLYFDALASFVSGKSSRQEFEDMTKQVLTSPHLLQLHNALIISLFDATATLKRPPTPPPPAVPKPPPQKRRRTLLPYQGPDVSEESRSIRGQKLKRWALSVGKRERERMRSIEAAPSSSDPPRSRKETDEIAGERGIELISERGARVFMTHIRAIWIGMWDIILDHGSWFIDLTRQYYRAYTYVTMLELGFNCDYPPGSRLPIHLHASTRAPTLQHVTDRVNLICAQNGLQNPARNVPALMTLACEAKLKQLITHALTLTSTSHAISSIAPALPSSSSGLHAHFPAHSHGSRPPVLTPDSFHTLFTVSPADLPNGSAAAMRFAMGPSAIARLLIAPCLFSSSYITMRRHYIPYNIAYTLHIQLSYTEKYQYTMTDYWTHTHITLGGRLHLMEPTDQATEAADPLSLLLQQREKELERLHEKERQAEKDKTKEKEKGNGNNKDGVKMEEPASDKDLAAPTPPDVKPPPEPPVDSTGDLRDDPRWQVMALLAHRSTVRDGISGRLNGAMRPGGKIGLGMGMGKGR